ncbi:MAG TPA: globin, partial [Burkholderiaceae bacterium]
SYYTDRFGHPMLRARHLPQQIGGHTIGIVERDQWLACMDEAMGQIGVHDGVRAHLREVLFGVADWMRNRPE